MFSLQALINLLKSRMPGLLNDVSILSKPDMVMSSHPAACLAVAKVFCGAIERVSLDYIVMQADAIFKTPLLPTSVMPSRMVLCLRMRVRWSLE